MFCLDEKHYCLEKFTFHNVHHAENPKPLNYHLMDKDCVAMLKRMYCYCGEDGSTKQELLEYGDVLINFLLGGDKKGKEVLKAVDDNSWEMSD
jgi:hypothetical protein